MSDDDGRLGGLIGAGQRTSERTGGDTDRVEARRHARDLALRRALSVAWLLLALPLLAGPWALCVLVPLAVAKLRRWFEPGRPPPHPLDLISIGVVVAFALALAAAFWPALVASWWPFHWQTDPASWWWLRMPTAWLLVRLVVIVAPLAGWRETWYLDQRQRQEIVAPTLSGVAYSSPDPHRVDVPGVWNPYRDPDDEPGPEPTTGDLVIRFVPETEAPGAQIISRDAVTGEPTAARGGNGNGHRSAEMVVPLSLIARRGEHRDDTIRHAEALAVGMLADGKASRSALTGYGLTGTAAREMQAWLVDRGYAHDTGDGAGYIVTATGRRWLTIARRHLRLVDVAG